MQASKMKVWVLLCRPWSLTAAIVPVVLGAAIVGWFSPHAPAFAPLQFSAVLAGAVLVQIAVNLLNAYGDYVSGLDRVPGTYVSHPPLDEKAFLPRHVLAAAMVCMFTAGLLGLALCFRAGVAMFDWFLLGVLCLGALGALNYTTGLRFKYRGMGVVAVFFLMGPLMVLGAAMAMMAPFTLATVQQGDFSFLSLVTVTLLLSVPISLLVAAILHGNDMRDMAGDRAAGIQTLAVRLGASGALILFTALHALAYVGFLAFVVFALWRGERFFAVSGLIALAGVPFSVWAITRAVHAWQANRVAPAWFRLERITGASHAVVGMLFATFLLTIHLTGCAEAKQPTGSAYDKTYAIVMSAATMEDPAWRAVADALTQKHPAARYITADWAYVADSLLPPLRATFPKYVCFVMKPEEAKFKTLVAIHRMMRRWDDDPYSDAIYTVLTAPTATDALRIAQADAPHYLRTCLATTGLDDRRFDAITMISDGERGLILEKPRGVATVTKRHEAGDTTAEFVSAWKTLDPDLLVTSAHASQRNLEMPFSQGNIVCKAGVLHGLARASMINYATGQAKTGAAAAGGEALAAPAKPKVILCVGNCLIGDIPDENCMALAFLGYGKATQFFGYSTTTWFGMAGWTLLRYIEQYPGVIPVSEAYFFSNQNLLYRLNGVVTNERDFNPTLSDPSAYNTELYGAMNTFGFTRGTMQVDNQKLGGMLWDRDATVLYGDPSFKAWIDPACAGANDLSNGHSFRVTQQADGRTYVAELRATRACDASNEYTAPPAAFLPNRIQRAVITEDAGGLTPVITDNFVFVPEFPAMASNSVLRVVFTAEPAEKCRTP